LRIADLKGQRAGVQKEIELQEEAVQDIKSRIDSSPKAGDHLYPGGPVLVNGNPMLEKQRDELQQKVISLQSELAKIDAELEALK
jgi:hypothetical protein